jgi:hypothetical protein
VIEHVRLGDLADTEVPPMSTLYVPPVAKPALDPLVAETFCLFPDERP